jgi:uncharacterized membrane protein
MIANISEGFNEWGGCMNERRDQRHSVRLWLAVGSLIFFSLCAVIAVVVWLPVLPEAAAVTLDPDSSAQWSQYISWHESWRYIDANIDSSNSCLR